MDITLARDLIDYNPTTVLRDGLEMTWKWFLDNQDEFKYKKNYFSEEKQGKVATSRAVRQAKRRRTGAGNSTHKQACRE